MIFPFETCPIIFVQYTSFIISCLYINIFLFLTFGSAIGIGTIISDLGPNVKQLSFKLLVELPYIVIVLLDMSTMALLSYKNVCSNIYRLLV